MDQCFRGRGNDPAIEHAGWQYQHIRRESIATDVAALPHPSGPDPFERSRNGPAADGATDIVGTVRTHRVQRFGVDLRPGETGLQNAHDVELQQIRIIVELTPDHAFSIFSAIHQRPPPRRTGPGPAGSANGQHPDARPTESADQSMSNGPVEAGVEQTCTSPWPGLLNQQQPRSRESGAQHGISA
jgi:hypothetical protein